MSAVVVLAVACALAVAASSARIPARAERFYYSAIYYDAFLLDNGLAVGLEHDRNACKLK